MGDNSFFYFLFRTFNNFIPERRHRLPTSDARKGVNVSSPLVTDKPNTAADGVGVTLAPAALTAEGVGVAVA